MPIKPVLLWSDLLLYSLVAVITLVAIRTAGNDQNRARWRHVFRSKLGLASFLVIVVYVIIGVADSMHFRAALPPVAGQPTNTTYYANDVHSLLDVLLGNMGQHTERTYSAPFALTAYAKENRQDAHGHTYRDFPALQHAGKHLSSADQRYRDILWQSLLGLAKGLLIAWALIMAHRWWLRRLTARQPAHYPWPTAYLTVTLILCLLAWLLHMSGFYHVFGTDKSGNDVLYISFKGVRTGLLIGTLATLVMMPIAISLGIAAGYFKGWVDDVVQYLYTTLSSIPGILLIAASVLLFQVWIDLHPHFFATSLEKGDVRFVALCFILGITSWTTLCRLLRAETLKLSQLDYVQAAHAFGVSHGNIVRRHILPNVTHIILITFILDFSALVLAEAVLAYIGVGVDAAMHSWGSMISAGSAELSREPAVWWNLSSAFVFMFGLVLAANLFADRANDAFDPKRAERHEPQALQPSA